MLFYDEHSRLCVKISDIGYYTLFDNDIIELNDTKYCYYYGIFYEVHYVNDEPTVDLSKKISPYKLGVKRKGDLFKDEWEEMRNGY